MESHKIHVQKHQPEIVIIYIIMNRRFKHCSVKTAACKHQPVSWLKGVAEKALGAVWLLLSDFFISIKIAMRSIHIIWVNDVATEACSPSL
jgi:hypothetical protein